MPTPGRSFLSPPRRSEAAPRTPVLDQASLAGFQRIRAPARRARHLMQKRARLDSNRRRRTPRQESIRVQVEKCRVQNNPPHLRWVYANSGQRKQFHGALRILGWVAKWDEY